MSEGWQVELVTDFPLEELLGDDTQISDARPITTLKITYNGNPAMVFQAGKTFELYTDELVRFERAMNLRTELLDTARQVLQDITNEHGGWLTPAITKLRDLLDNQNQMGLQ